jgi:predicted ATPase
LDPVRRFTTGGSGVESRFEAQHGAALTPLVGREEELELLLRRWQQAKAGDGSVVLISREPGIGKSRLAQTLLERVSGEVHTRLRSFCSPCVEKTLNALVAQVGG